MTLSGFLTREEVLVRLRAALRAGEQRALAERVGISPQHLCDLLRGRRDPAGKVLEYLGLEPVARLYQPVGKAKKK
jgi:transcriptional regulator with XRE-family HTH domain